MSNNLIEEATYSGIIDPSADWHTLDFKGRQARLTYRVRVQCNTHYYNATCTKFCRPRDDKFGHYMCDSNGDKVCIDGWKGNNCETGKFTSSRTMACLTTYPVCVRHRANFVESLFRDVLVMQRAMLLT